MSKSVFVFDGELTTRRLYEVVLGGRGIQTETFEDTASGLGQLKAGVRPNLILLDIRLPDMDGLLFLEKLKNDSITRSIPVVLVSAFTQQSLVLRGIKAGAADYIRKPFHPQEFGDRLMRHLA